MINKLLSVVGRISQTAKYYYGWARWELTGGRRRLRELEAEWALQDTQDAERDTEFDAECTRYVEERDLRDAEWLREMENGCPDEKLCFELLSIDKKIRSERAELISLICLRLRVELGKEMRDAEACQLIEQDMLRTERGLEQLNERWSELAVDLVYKYQLDYANHL